MKLSSTVKFLLTSMITKRIKPLALVAFTAAMLLPGFTAHARSIQAPVKPLTTRVHEADKVFVAELVNRKLLKDDWCHADLKVTNAIKGVKLGELVPVVWRPKVARYDAEENQMGLAVLKHAHEKRYWLRLDTFVDNRILAEQAAHWLGETDGILRQYVDRAILTKEQEKIVIELAQKTWCQQGGKDHHLLPTPIIRSRHLGLRSRAGQGTRSLTSDADRHLQGLE